MLKILRVKLLARAKFRFLREQPDDFFFCGELWSGYMKLSHFTKNLKSFDCFLFLFSG